MNPDRRVAGFGAIAFAVALVVGFSLFGPKGGAYAAAEVAAFLEQPPLNFVASIGLIFISSIGLMTVMSYLSEISFGADRNRRVTWAATVVSIAAFLIGWGLYLAPASSLGSGGPTLDPGLSYAFLSAGMAVVFGVGGAALGIALLTLALGGRALPMWVRGAAALAGLAGLLTWVFLAAVAWSPNQWLPGPFYLVILWGLVIGVWLLIPSSRTDLHHQDR